ASHISARIHELGGPHRGGRFGSPHAGKFLCPVLQKPFDLRVLDDKITGVVEGADAERVVA
ncbi:MAG: hypothetical protein M3Z05_06640, partial [Gemmatimonadota bacterium]|nr:hypothetical protein [Gemmatimonadota bacterium]